MNVSVFPPMRPADALSALRFPERTTPPRSHEHLPSHSRTSFSSQATVRTRAYMPAKYAIDIVLVALDIGDDGTHTPSRPTHSNPGRCRRTSAQIQVGGGTFRKMADDQRLASSHRAVAVCPVRVALLRSKTRHCSGTRIMTLPPPSDAIFTVPEGNRGLSPTRGVKNAFRRAGNSRLTKTDILTAWARGALALVPKEYQADYLSRPGWSLLRVDGFTLVTPPPRYSQENGAGLSSRPEGGDD